MWRLILRSLSVRKGRTITTVAAIAIGMLLMVTLVSMSEGFKAQTDKVFEDFDRITVTSDQLTGSLPYSYVDTVEDIPGVTGVDRKTTEDDSIKQRLKGLGYIS